jgi:hypothetical protein
MHFLKKNVRPTPWNVVMDIGPNIRIAVSGYRKVCVHEFDLLVLSYALQFSSPRLCSALARSY